MMRTTGRPWGAAVLVALVVVVTSCGSDGTDGESEEPTAPGNSANTSSSPVDGDDGSTESEQRANDQAAEESSTDIFPEIALDPTDPGPRPTLSWAEVEGVAIYQLTVLDADGVPYWSWSGTETAVPIGGVDDPDAIGAWVFEELTWMVVARDASGVPLGMSRRGTLQP